ncbi:type II toxin-antitoxin system Phd/YefM family antitoxin [Pleomorphomonas carboxyditropha]|uniref:Antitoxin n=1 Tax=Pleomorphomonas carboxyditropha TaxID=2023338 RepID=A0A2G9WS19_9HYPH|nr:type II toxin-antitoxin system Phd/YefM family antitoxin [Pleomorphomonas carboxyditropha]PIO97519.1 hypothetical protein CJ014_19945 [Pleomorphomonas carboxyditropha]
MATRSSRKTPGSPPTSWRLQDAKVRLSEVVRHAQTSGPQRVTLHGQDAAVIVSAADFDRIQKPVSGLDLVTALAESPLQDVSFDREPFKAPVRDVPL